MNEVVKARGLTKRYGEFQAVNGIDFTVYQGECFGLLGPNGAGKTSTVAMVYGFAPISGGELLVFGLDAHYQQRQIKAMLGVVPQKENLDPDLTVAENLLVYGSYFGLPRQVVRQRTQALLESAGLTARARTPVEQLSGGMQRRLTIARALINGPRLLLLDEPTTGLDPQARHLVWQQLRLLKNQGVAMLLTTHYMEEASQLCDRLVIMDRGRILEQGSPRELVHQHIGREVVELGIGELPPEQVLELVAELEVEYQLAGDTLLLFDRGGQQVWSRIEGSSLSFHYRLLRPATLEDVFLKLTGRGLGDAA